MPATLHPTIYHWIGFNLAIAALLGMELIRFARNPRPISVTESLINSCGWIALSLLFNAWIYWTFGQASALDFLTGYIIEKSLSVDNLFLFLVLFAHFKVPEEAKHKVLFYGIIGAIVMRALLIWGGIAAVEHFEWALQVFGLFLVITGVRFAFDNEKKEELKEKAFFRFLKKHLPFTDQFHGNAFFFQGKATPLFAALLLIEATDLIFALDSVPAILGITTDPFIVYTSNICAVLGLRSLFFALQGVMNIFHLLHYALAFILVFIGCKMVFEQFYHIPTLASLIVIGSALALAIITSLLFPLRGETGE